MSEPAVKKRCLRLGLAVMGLSAWTAAARGDGGGEKKPPVAREGGLCKRDEQCGWKDPCHPVECVPGGRAERMGVRCGGSPGRPSGTCGCFNDACTIKPDRPQDHAAPAPQVCKLDESCALDFPTGLCLAAAGHRRGPRWVQGPYCACEHPARGRGARKPEAVGGCRLLWLGPVRCKTFRDCWYSRRPVLHPVKARRPRRRKVRPCRDGELDSLCVEGLCRVVGWSC